MTPPDSDAREVDIAQEELRRAAHAAAKDTLDMLGSVLLPLSLAQRILAALESVDGGMDMACASLASELRAVIGK